MSAVTTNAGGRPEKSSAASGMRSGSVTLSRSSPPVLNAEVVGALFGGQHRCVGVLDVRSPPAIAAKARINEELAGRHGGLFGPATKAQRCCEVPSCAISADDDTFAIGGKMQKARLGVIALGGMKMLGCESVGDGNHLEAGCPAKACAGVGMAIEPTQNKTAAVQIEHRRSGVRFGAGAAVAARGNDSLWLNSGNIEVLRGHPIGERLAHLRSIPVVPGAVLSDRECVRIRRIKRVCASDVGEHFRIGRHRLGSLIGHKAKLPVPRYSPTSGSMPRLRPSSRLPSIHRYRASFRRLPTLRRAVGEGAP